ncbi:MAG: CBS domain-containing protein [Gammaproteobacteria bacterium]
MKSICVRDYMATELVTLNPEMEILRAVHILLEHEFGGAPVVDDTGRLIGILTEKDCMKVVLNAGYHAEYGGRVTEFMSHEVETMQPDDSIVEAAQRFLDENFHRYPVVVDNELVGQISRRDVMRALEHLW